MAKFQVTFPDNTVKTFASANHVYTHMVIAKFDYGTKNAEGDFVVTRSTWRELRRSRSWRTAQSYLSEVRRNASKAWFSDGSEYRRMGEVAILAVDVVQPKAKKAAAPKKAAKNPTVISTRKVFGLTSDAGITRRGASFEIVLERELRGQVEFTVKTVTPSFALKAAKGESYTFKRDYHTESYDFRSGLPVLRYFKQHFYYLNNGAIIRRDARGNVTVYEIKG